MKHQKVPRAKRQHLGDFAMFAAGFKIKHFFEKFRPIFDAILN